MAAWGYEFYCRVLKGRFAHSSEILSALEDKICIPVQPFNILYL